MTNTSAFIGTVALTFFGRWVESVGAAITPGDKNESKTTP